MHAIHPEMTPEGPVLHWEARDPPECGPEDVIVAVRATAVNRADLLQAQGLYPPPPGDSEVLGLELAGTIHQTRDRVKNWRSGDRVFALAPGGGYAELARVDHRMLLPVPADWDWETAAAVPEAWLTVFSNLIVDGGLERGETVLIHAGASGVGTAAIQLAKDRGATVAVTAGAEEKCRHCRRLGADLAVNYKNSDFHEAVSQRFPGGVDLILDPVGGPYLAGHLRLLRENGRLMVIGLLGGRRGEMDMAQLLGKSLRVAGTRLRARPLADKIRLTAAFREMVFPALVDGRLKPVLDRAFSITDADAAHRWVRENRNLGKVILRIP